MWLLGFVPNVTHKTDSKTVPPRVIEVTGDALWGCIVWDYHFLTVLHLFISFPKGSHDSLTLWRSHFRDSATATLSIGDGTTCSNQIGIILNAPRCTRRKPADMCIRDVWDETALYSDDSVTFFLSLLLFQYTALRARHHAYKIAPKTVHYSELWSVRENIVKTYNIIIIKNAFRAATWS